MVILLFSCCRNSLKFYIYSISQAFIEFSLVAVAAENSMLKRLSNPEKGSKPRNTRFVKPIILKRNDASHRRRIFALLICKTGSNCKLNSIRQCNQQCPKASCMFSRTGKVFDDYRFCILKSLDFQKIIGPPDGIRRIRSS